MISITITTSRATYDDHYIYSHAYVISCHNAETILHPVVKEVSYEKARHLQALLYKKYGDKLIRENKTNSYDTTIYNKDVHLWLYD